MPAEVDPIVGTWYCHLDKGQRFFVVAVDEISRTVDVQYFDGCVDEYDVETWYQMDIDVCEAPENWAGPLDFDSTDDLGTEITDTRAEDWNAPFSEFESKYDRPDED